MVGRMALIGCVLWLAGCSGSRVVTSWEAPGLAGDMPQQVLVVVPMIDGATRRSGEDLTVATLTAVTAQPSYPILSTTESIPITPRSWLPPRPPVPTPSW